jgi:hypothetical protein
MEELEDRLEEADQGLKDIGDRHGYGFMPAPGLFQPSHSRHLKRAGCRPMYAPVHTRARTIGFGRGGSFGSIVVLALLPLVFGSRSA